MDAEETAIHAEGGALPGLLVRPDHARWLYVLAHGAGAGMRHPFLAGVAAALAARAVATLRWELPYMAARRKRPDPPEVAEAAVVAAVAHARQIAGGLRVAAGGKSFGGRMTSQAAAHAAGAHAALALDAIIFLGFPLHPAKQPSVTRARHLADVPHPMLFVQGTRDALAEPALLRPIVASLPRATLVEIDGADHGFAVPARRKGDDVVAELADHVARWLGALPA
jgi:predicted alpha/beta-hydrolase family hydrolase